MIEIISPDDAWSIGITFALIFLDIVTGIMKAASQHNINSEDMRCGLWHKAGFVTIIALAVMLDIAQGHIDLGFDIPLVGAVTLYLSLTEVTSILENISSLSPELGDKEFMKIFASSRGSDASAKDSATEDGKNDSITHGD